MMTIQRVAIVGTGSVGAALAKNLVSHGVSVQLASTDLEKTRVVASTLGERARAVTTSSIGDVDAVFLAIPADAAPAVLEAATGLAAGTIVVDCTNPITWNEGPVHVPPPEGSTTAQLAARFPKLRVLKGFNTFGAEFHEHPELGTASANLYLAGDDAEAKRALGELARRMGFDPVDTGPLRNARHLESLAILWIHLATVGGRGRDFVFELIARGDRPSTSAPAR